MTRVRHVRTFADLEALESVWKAFESKDDSASVFQSWDWNRTWCEMVLPRRKGARLDIRLLEDDAGHVLAILPLYEEPLAGPLARITQFLGHRMSTRNGFLVADPRSTELADFVVRTLRHGLGPRSILHLRHLDEAAAITQRLIAHGLADWLCARALVAADPAITDQQQRLSRNTRRVTRKRENKLKREFDVSYSVRSGADFLEAFDELIDLHSHRFVSTGRTSFLAGDNLQFLRRAASTLNAKGCVEIIQLRADQKTIAARLTVRDKNSYVFYQGGFDPDFARFAPMRLLFGQVLHRAFEDLGYALCDLGPAVQSHKLDWQPRLGASYSCCLGGPGPYAKAMAMAYHAAFKRRFPHPDRLKGK